MKLQSIALKLFALCAAFMIYYGFYTRLKRVASPVKPTELEVSQDTMVWQSDSVRWE